MSGLKSANRLVESRPLYCRLLILIRRALQTSTTFLSLWHFPSILYRSSIISKLIHAAHSRTNTNKSTVLVAGLPLDQKVVQYGPFVLNTQDEVYQALMDYQTHSNGFERAKGWKSEIGKSMIHWGCSVGLGGGGMGIWGGSPYDVWSRRQMGQWDESNCLQNLASRGVCFLLCDVFEYPLNSPLSCPDYHSNCNLPICSVTATLPFNPEVSPRNLHSNYSDLPSRRKNRSYH